MHLYPISYTGIEMLLASWSLENSSENAISQQVMFEASSFYNET